MWQSLRAIVLKNNELMDVHIDYAESEENINIY